MILFVFLLLLMNIKFLSLSLSISFDGKMLNKNHRGVSRSLVDIKKKQEGAEKRNEDRKIL